MEKKQDRLESIQILRGLAAISVMLLHFTAANGNFTEKLPNFSDFFRYGNWGVQAFFVISGMVIPHYMRLSNYTLRESRHFIVSRLIRLEPPYILSIVVVLVIGYAASKAPGQRGAPFTLDPAGLALHLFYLAPWFDKPWVNDVYWTLAIELQYYVLMLLFAPLLISKKSSSVILFFALVIAAALVPFDNRAIFRHLPFFAIGFVGFTFYHSTLPKWCIAFVAFLVFLEVAIGYGVVGVVVGIGALGVIFIPIKSPIPVLSFLGSISYSLYLLHAPIGGRIINLTTRYSPAAALVGLVAAVVISCVAAYLMWRFVERPAMRAAQNWTRRHSVQLDDSQPR